MITSELDVLPELSRGELVFLPLRDKGLTAPSISVVIDARRPLPRAARLVSAFLVERTQIRLAEARAGTVSPADT
jgi:hypothetical protein